MEQKTLREVQVIHNVGVEYSTTSHGLVDHRTSTVSINIHNPFQLVLLAIVDVKNKVIGNLER